MTPGRFRLVAPDEPGAKQQAEIPDHEHGRARLFATAAAMAIGQGQPMISSLTAPQLPRIGPWGLLKDRGDRELGPVDAMQDCVNEVVRRAGRGCDPIRTVLGVLYYPAAGALPGGP